MVDKLAGQMVFWKVEYLVRQSEHCAVADWAVRKVVWMAAK